MRTLQLTFTLTTLFYLHISAPSTAGNPESFQPGYIIIQSDTVKGLVLVASNFTNWKQCIFKETAIGTAREYSPHDIAGYGVDGKTSFLAAAIPNENPSSSKVFLSCLVKTDVSLYTYRNRFFLRDENGITELKEVKAEIIRNGKTYNEKRPLYKSVLQQQLDECSTIHEKLGDTKLTQSSLVTLLKDYAVCTGQEATDFSAGYFQRRSVRYGFTVGLLAAELKFRSPANVRYFFGEHASGDRSFTFTPSFFVDLGISRKLNFSTGISWYSTKHHLSSVSASDNLTHDFHLEASRIEVPFLLKYSLSNGPVKWSLKGGCGLNGLFKYEDRLVVSTTSSGYELSKYNNDLEKNDLFRNWMGGVSMECSLGNRPFLVEGYYSRSEATDSGTGARLEGFKVSIGIFL